MPMRNVVAAKKAPRLAACLLITMLLAGCAAPLQERKAPEGQPDDIVLNLAAPQADSLAEREMQAVLYYPTADASRVRGQVAPVTVRGGEEEAEAVLRVLLTAAPPAGMRPVAPGVMLEAVEHPVVVSGEVATVSLTPEARRLSPRDLCAARMAITNTLTELGDITYVNVLVEGMEEGADLAASLPSGTLTRQSSGDVDAAWQQIEAQQAAIGQQSLSKLVTIYVPAPGGRYILPQVRSVSFADAQPVTLVMGMLKEISKGAIGLEGAPGVPDLAQYLAAQPEVLQQADSSARVIRLNFHQELEQALVAAGLGKGALCALLSQSIATFVPGVLGVQIRLGVDALVELSATETLGGWGLSAAGDHWPPELFWEDVGAFAQIALPMLEDGHLSQVSRPIQATRRLEPRYLMEQLLLGPQRADARTNLSPALPSGLGAEDVLAIALQGDMALVNVSQRFAQTCAQLDAAGERNGIYAIVNTLTEFSYVRRVAFFVEGEQVQRFSGALEMRGFFLSNPGLFQ